MKSQFTAAAVVSWLLLGIHAEAAVYTVINTDDSGPGSLRQAVLDANAHGDLDLISFNIPGPGPHRLSPVSPLPALTQSVIVDGYTQPGARPNSLPVGNNAVIAIELYGADTLGDGLSILGETGAKELQERFFSICGLVINSFAHGAAIAVRQMVDARDIRIEGNFIGTDSTGNTALSNLVGVSISGSTVASIGGKAPQARNVISGNGTGIACDGAGLVGPFVTTATALGNYIGTDASGTRAVGNGTGATCSSAQGFSSANLRLGGVVPGTANVISGNYGDAVVAQNRAGVGLEGNLIGVSAGGTRPLPNKGNGVKVGHYCRVTATDNVIAFNEGHAVHVPSGWEQVETALVRRNFIYDNQRLGINLQPGYSPAQLVPEPDNTVTRNDIQDQDRNLPNYPEITGVIINEGKAYIEGSYNSTPNTTSTLDFFRSSRSDPSGYGQGEIYLGSTQVITDVNGNTPFTWPTPDYLEGQFVTATASPGDGTTSEFSRALQATGTFAGNIGFSATSWSAHRRYKEAIIEVIRLGGNGAASAHLTTLDETATAGVDYIAVDQALSFAPGETSKKIAIQLLPALLTGSPKSLGLLLSEPSAQADLGRIRRASLTLLDSVEPPSLSISDALAGAGETAVFVVELSRSSDAAVSVHYATIGTGKTQYASAAGEISFAPGELEKEISIRISGPLQPPDFMSLVVFDAAHAVIGNHFGTAIPPAVLSLEGLTGQEGKDSTFELSLSRPTDVTLDYSIGALPAGWPQSATPQKDFLPQSGTISFRNGETQKSISVPILKDSEIEPDEHFMISLSNLRGHAVLLNGSSAFGVILGDPVLAVDSVQGREGTGFRFTVSLSRPSPGVSVDYTVVPETATPDRDYLPKSGTLTFGPDQTRATITVPVLADAETDPEESFLVRLSNPRGAFLVGPEGRGTITSLPGIRVEDAIGYRPSGLIRFKVVLSRSGDASVEYLTADGTAKAGQDYVPQGGLVRFTGGTVSDTVTIQTLGSSRDDLGKTVRLLLRSPENSFIDRGEGIGTIIAIAPSVLTQDDAETPPSAFQVPVTLSYPNPFRESIVVDYHTEDATAQASKDYVSQLGRVVILPGQTQSADGPVRIIPVAGSLSKVGKSFAVVLGPVSLCSPSGTCTVASDIMVDPGRAICTFIDRPQLRIIGKSAIEWAPPQGESWILETSPTLGPAVWTPTPNPDIGPDGKCQFDLLFNEPRMFYRLRR